MLPGRILAGILEEIFFLAESRRLQIYRRDFYELRVGNLAGKDPDGKTGHLARESWRDPAECRYLFYKDILLIVNITVNVTFDPEFISRQAQQ